MAGHTIAHLSLKFRCKCRTEFEVYRRIPQTERCPECETWCKPADVLVIETGKRLAAKS